MKFNLKELKQTYIIAEMSANHAGCLENAKKIIGAAKEAGADCIKIQTYTPDTMTIDCTNKYFQIDGGTWDGENLYHLYEKAYTPWEWQEELKQQAEELELDFLSTQFDKTSVDFLEDLGVEFYKIASFELVDIPLIEYVASKGKPIILSTGMGTKEEIEEAVSAIKAQENDKVVLLRCSSAYPAVSDEMNLLTIQDMKKYFGLPVGLSDHSMGSVAAVTAVALGARVIEKHFCLNRDIKNPDASFSMEPTEFQQMVQDVRAAERAIGTVNYGPSDQEKNSIIFRRSIFAVEDIEKGETITEKNTRVIRPGYRLKPKEYKKVLGMVAKKHISYGEPLSYDKLEV